MSEPTCLKITENSEVEFVQKQTKESAPKERSCYESLKWISQNITIEPVLFLFVTGLAIHALTAENLLIEKVCLTINKFPKDVCANIQDKKYSDIIDQVQKNVSYWKMAISISTAVFSILYSIVVGSWSDKHGRKTFIVLPIFGLTVGTFIYMILASYLYSPVWLLVIQGIVPSLFGGYGLFVCCLAYITDTSTPKTRTIRIAILEGCAYIGAPLGLFIGGALFKKFGYMAVFGTSAAIEIIAVVYAILRIEESNKDLAPSTIRQKIRDLFRFNNIVESFKAFTSPRERRTQVTLVLLLVSSLIAQFAHTGTQKIQFLFTQKMFHWDISTYSNYESMTMIGGILLTALAIVFLIRKFKLNDNLVGAICGIFAIAGYSIISLASYTWMLYTGTILADQQVVILMMVKSIVTKIVSSGDIGKVLSFLTCCEQASPLIADSVYPAVYANTVDIFPGLLFMVSAFLFVYPLALFLWLAIDASKKGGEKTPLIINTKEETT